VTSRLRQIAISVGVFLIAALLVIVLTLLLLGAMGKDPGEVAVGFVQSALGTPGGRADVLMTALPMLLCASGLLLTFTAGLWNIGVEGQMVMGAVCATAIARTVTPTDTSPFIVPAELILAMLGGAAWAGLAALLKTKGRVNEIFGGVALNFVAQNVMIYLLSGPWQGRKAAIQTGLFAPPALLPRLASTPDLRISPLAIVLAVVAFVSVYFVLRGTRWGLELKAMGRSSRSAFLLGVRTERNTLIAMMFCGALAGLAGSFQALFLRGQLVSGISGGIGYFGVLIVLLTDIQAIGVPLAVLFFALIPIGTVKLETGTLALDASIGNVFQSALVLIALLINGVRTMANKQT
jgi:simple sugar transport system permease protein